MDNNNCAASTPLTADSTDHSESTASKQQQRRGRRRARFGQMTYPRWRKGPSAKTRSTSESTKYYFDWIFVKRFGSILRCLFELSPLSWLIFAFLLLLSILEELVVYQVGMITANYYKILIAKDINGFWIQTVKSLSLVACIAFVKSSRIYTASSLYVFWRHQLTKFLHMLYFHDKSYYELNVTDRNGNGINPPVIDNPDQRITQDVEKLCRSTCDILPAIIVSPFKIAWYSYKSWTLVGYIGPLGCFAFFAICTIINKWLMSPIVNLIYYQERREGQFRFEHMNIRSNAESIALISGAHIEHKESDRLLYELISTQERVIFGQFKLDLATKASDYGGSLVSFLVLAVPLFTGLYDHLTSPQLGSLISQNTFISMYLVNCFTSLVDLSGQVTTVAGTTHRVEQLLRALKRKQMLSVHEQFPDDQPEGPLIKHHHHRTKDHMKQNYFIFKNVTIKLPHSEALFYPLVAQLDLCIYRGLNVLITGSSGSGKTSILRVLKGLWKPTKGQVYRYLQVKNPSVVMFLPQKPAMLIQATLRQQIMYPILPEEALITDVEGDTAHIVSTLKFVQLDHILDRFDGNIDALTDMNWHNQLSPGEMQLLSIARLLYHNPLVAVMDEATSAVSEEMESKVYGELKRVGITVITAGHRESLKEYHEIELKLTLDSIAPDQLSSTWVLRNLNRTPSRALTLDESDSDDDRD